MHLRSQQHLCAYACACICLCDTGIFRNDPLVAVRLGNKANYVLSLSDYFFILDSPFCCINYRIGTNLSSKLLIIILIIMNKESIISCADSKLVNVL